MRLTAELILNARARINPLRERELDLRGYKIPVLENLGATKDGYDCLDMSDNEIKKLENFPRLKRLRMLLLHNNKIHRFQENLAESIPNLTLLAMTNNNIANLTDIDALRCFDYLAHTLTLSGNPITRKAYYREYVIHTLPNLRVLDYKKIRPVEREEAVRLFNSLAGKKIVEGEAGQPNETNVPQTISSPEASSARPTLAQLKSAISQAKSVDEVERLEAQIKALSPPRNYQPPAPVAVPPPPPLPKKSPQKAAATTVNHKVAYVKAEVVSPKKEQTETKASPRKASPRKAVVPAPVPTEIEDVDMEVEEKPATPVKQTPNKSSKASSTPASSMKVTELREELKRRGLPTKGNKAELVARLDAALAE